MSGVALITGASEGLGKSFVFELASRGMKLVLAALPGSGLQALGRYVQQNFGVEVIIFELDLSQAKSCGLIFSALRENATRVDMLINNAGLGNLSRFEENSAAFYQMQISLNITSVVLLTRMFLSQIDPGLDSYILNVGSLGGRFLVPRKQVYGATKSFITYFTHCLRLERDGSRVKISLLSPGGINTKPDLLVMNHALRGFSAATIMEPDRVARIAINGLLKGQREIIPGMINRLLVAADWILPKFIKDILIKRQLGRQRIPHEAPIAFCKNTKPERNFSVTI